MWYFIHPGMLHHRRFGTICTSREVQQITQSCPKACEVPFCKLAKPNAADRRKGVMVCVERPNLKRCHVENLRIVVLEIYVRCGQQLLLRIKQQKIFDWTR